MQSANQPGRHKERCLQIIVCILVGSGDYACDVRTFRVLAEQKESEGCSGDAQRNPDQQHEGKRTDENDLPMKFLLLRGQHLRAKQRQWFGVAVLVRGMEALGHKSLRIASHTVSKNSWYGAERRKT